MSTSGPNPFAAVVAGVLDEEAERDAIVKSCIDALARADGVVSVPSLCNRLWLGWGIDGYENAAASALIDAVPGVVHNEPRLPEHADPDRDTPKPQPAVALGAIVKVDLGYGPAYAEVVYKEGAHRALDAGWVPKWLAGAPALPDTDAAPPPDYEPPPDGEHSDLVIRERLALDFACFGASFAPTARQWANLLRKQRYLDALGHLVIHARYEPGDDTDDLGFWAHWVVAHSARALEVAGIDPDAVAIRQAAAQLAEAVGSHADVRGFGPYLLHEEHYRRLLGTGPDPDRYDRVARGLSHPYRREQRGWAAMSERVRTEIGEEMEGTSWADHVIVASARTLELLSDEAPTGDWNGVHLRLDDPWQGGGLWRTEVLSATGPIALDPALALGLGWAEYTGDSTDLFLTGGGDEPAVLDDWLDGHAQTPLVGDLLADEDPTDLVDERGADLASTQLVWRVHVTGADITAGRLRMTSQVAPFIKAALETADQERVYVVLDHEGVGEFPQWCSLLPTETQTHLSFEWPPLLRAGTTLEVSWGIGSLVVRAQSRLLLEPEYIDEVEFTHEFNEQVALAALGHRPPTQSHTLERLVRAVIRRRGQVSDDGRRCLTITEIVGGCFGPTGEVAPEYGRPVLVRVVTQAVTQMVRNHRAERDGDLVLIEEATRASGRLDRELVNRFVDSTAQRLRRAATKSWVAPSVMNLRFYRPSPAKRESWEEVRGTDGLPDTDLEGHQTWRKGHLRNGVLPPDLLRRLDRARAAAAALGATEDQQSLLTAAVHDHYDQTDPLETHAPEHPDADHHPDAGRRPPPEAGTPT